MGSGAQGATHRTAAVLREERQVFSSGTADETRTLHSDSSCCSCGLSFCGYDVSEQSLGWAGNSTKWNMHTGTHTHTHAPHTYTHAHRTHRGICNENVSSSLSR